MVKNDMKISIWNLCAPWVASKIWRDRKCLTDYASTKHTVLSTDLTPSGVNRPDKYSNINSSKMYLRVKFNIDCALLKLGVT